MMELRLPTALAAIPPRQRPVVLVGPFEHHSNELPWRESAADVIAIGEDRRGHIDLATWRRSSPASPGGCCGSAASRPPPT